MKSIWKLKKKFEIQAVGQNLFLISFEGEEDLKMNMEGYPWFFHQQLIIFYSLVCPVERSKIKLIVFPFWLKVGLCLPERDKKDFMHAIGTTFGGLIRSEIKGEFCRLRVHLDAQKPLRRGIFILMENSKKNMVSF